MSKRIIAVITVVFALASIALSGCSNGPKPDDSFVGTFKAHYAVLTVFPGYADLTVTRPGTDRISADIYYTRVDATHIEGEINFVASNDDPNFSQGRRVVITKQAQGVLLVQVGSLQRYFCSDSGDDQVSNANLANCNNPF